MMARQLIITPESPTEEQWQAVINDNAAYDGQFFYAVKTTGIFCRPSCKSKPPNKDNIGIFRTAEQALSASYRPCKRCKPTGERLPDDDWIALVTAYIDNNYAEALTLEHLANICHGSAYHLHRTFKKVKDVTPVQYIQQQRIKRAIERLMTTDLSIKQVGLSVGLPNTPYFITLFKKITGCTPATYRHKRS